MRPKAPPDVIICPSDGLDDGAAPVADCNVGCKDPTADVVVGPKSNTKRCHCFKVVCKAVELCILTEMKSVHRCDSDRRSEAKCTLQAAVVHRQKSDSSYWAG